MKNAIINKAPIHVDLNPNRDEIHSGICIKHNPNIYMFVAFNDELGKFDGYAILRGDEIQQYRYWDEEELSEIKTNNFSEFEGKLPLENINSFYDCLNELTEVDIIAVFTDEDEDSNFIGKIISINPEEIEFKLIDDEANWMETITIEIDDINYIGFDSSYEKELIEMLSEKA